jgi:hypothetical protein
MNSTQVSLPRERKKSCLPIVICAALLLSPTLTYAPQNRALEIQSSSLATEDQVELVGVWPYGPCRASAIDSARNIAVIGNGETLQVLDISTPSSLSKIGEVRLEGTPRDIVLAGNYAYLVTLGYLVIVDLTDPKIPCVVTSIPTGEGPIQSLAFASNCVYLCSTAGLFIYDVSNPRQPVYQVRYPPNGLEVLDFALWRNYALCLCAYWEFPYHLEKTYGVQVIDISIPAAPILIGTFDLDKDYEPREIDVSGDGYAYVCQYSSSFKTGRISVINVATDPRNPSEIGRYVKSGQNFAGLALSGSYAYLMQSSPCRLVTLNISNAIYPVYVGECDADCQFEDVVSSGNLVGISHGGGGFSLYNVTDAARPFRLANYDTPDTPPGRVNGIAARGDYVYLACTSDGLRTMDVSTPSNPREASVCNEKRQGGGLAVSGKYAYGVDGHSLSIFDISSPRDASRVADLQLPCPEPASDSYVYCGVAVRVPYAYVSGTNWGGNPTRAILWVVDVSDPSAPRLVSSLVCAYKAVNIGSPALSGNYLYLGLHDNSQGEEDRRSSLRVIDISDPRNPREVYASVSSVPASFGINVVVRGNYAYLTGDMLRIYDLSNPGYPSLLISYVVGSMAIAFSGDYIYLNSDRLWVIDISNIYYPTGVYCRGEMGTGIDVSGNIAYVPGSLSVFRNKMAPDVSITSPPGLSTLLGSVPIDVQAAHSSGIDRVEFYVDDSFKGSDTSAPYSYTWDTRPYEDGLHTIRTRAYNKNGKSSDTEREVFTKLVYAPLSFEGEKVLNRSLAQAEYINILSWRAHPNNVNIVKYRLYQVEGKKRSLLVESGADTFQYWHRQVKKDEPYTYALIAVNNVGRESDPVSVTVR